MQNVKSKDSNTGEVDQLYGPVKRNFSFYADIHSLVTEDPCHIALSKYIMVLRGS